MVTLTIAFVVFSYPKQWFFYLQGLLELGQTVDKALKADFTEEALDNLPDPQNRDQENVKLNKLFQKGVEVGPVEKRTEIRRKAKEI